MQQLANSILEPEWIRMAVSALSVKELTVKKLSWPARDQKEGKRYFIAQLCILMNQKTSV